MIIALKFWIFPAIVTGALPWLLELNRENKLPNRKIRPLWYYLGAFILGPVVAGLALVVTGARNESLFLIPGAVVFLATIWMGAFSRPRSFDPFLGAWCVVCGILAVYTVAVRDEGGLAGLVHILVWVLIGLPLALIALIIAVILHQQPVVADPGIPGSDSSHQAAGS